MKKTVLLLLALPLFIGMTSCSDQKKAEGQVKDLIEKFSTYPDTYEPIEFMDLQKKESNAYCTNYTLDHLYRIQCKDGIKRVVSHSFTVSKVNDSGKMSVVIQPFEYWE